MARQVGAPLGASMTDRDLLEAAAKACGLPECGWMGPAFIYVKDNTFTDWNPLADDGDALRLAVRLNISVFPYDDETSTGTAGVVAKNWGSKEANTRRAIVLAAAAMDQTEGTA